MPSTTTAPSSSNGSSGSHELVRFTNCQALLPDGTLCRDISTYSLLVDPAAGRIVDGQSAFFDSKVAFTSTIDLDGDYLVPGFIDVQINGGYGVDFSEFQDGQEDEYLERLDEFSRRIVETGVTSFVPTIITQTAESYKKILPLLAPRSRPGQADVLGWHCEGPFLSPHKKGAHCSSLIRTSEAGMASLEAVYGSESTGLDMPWPAVKLLTLAPEVPGILETIPALVSRGVTVSIGHTASDIDTALAANAAGARFITHLFNAMGSFNHRDPGVIGLLGSTSPPRSYYGLIADGFHSHPCSVRMAYSSHPSGCVLVSDAMPWMDPSKPDGVYPWRQGQNVTKTGNKVVLEGTDTLAGSVVPISDCVTNLVKYAGVGVADAAKCATANPAQMLGLQHKKGFLTPGNDADLVVLDKHTGEVKQTWVSGRMVWSKKTGHVGLGSSKA